MSMPELVQNQDGISEQDSKEKQKLRTQIEEAVLLKLTDQGITEVEVEVNIVELPYETGPNTYVAVQFDGIGTSNFSNEESDSSTNNLVGVVIDEVIRMFPARYEQSDFLKNRSGKWQLTMLF